MITPTKEFLEVFKKTDGALSVTEIKYKNGIYPIHNKSHTKVWAAWQTMKGRCYNKNNHKNKIHGKSNQQKSNKKSA